MKKLLKKLLVAGLAAGSLASMPAQAAVVQLANPGAMTTVYLNDFETVKNSGPVTFDAASGLQFASGYAGNVTSSGVRGLASGSFPGIITADLSGYYGAVGMFFGNDDRCCAQGFSAVLSVFDNATLLGSVSVAANMNDFADQFIGLSSSSAFNRVQIDYGNAGLYTFVDDFRLGAAAAAVPEPATWGMMILGFGVIGGVLRRKKASGTAFA